MGIPWENLYSPEQLEQVKEESYARPVILYKHSTRCGVSDWAKTNLEKADGPVSTEKYYYLDLISYREVSNAIEAQFNVLHQSPQVLLIRNGECVYTVSHADIQLDKLHQQLALLQ